MTTHSFYSDWSIPIGGNTAPDKKLDCLILNIWDQDCHLALMEPHWPSFELYIDLYCTFEKFAESNFLEGDITLTLFLVLIKP